MDLAKHFALLDAQGRYGADIIDAIRETHPPNGRQVEVGWSASGYPYWKYDDVYVYLIGGRFCYTMELQLGHKRSNGLFPVELRKRLEARTRLRTEWHTAIIAE